MNPTPQTDEALRANLQAARLASESHPGNWAKYGQAAAAAPPAPGFPEPVTITPDADSKLAWLQSQYTEAKRAKDAADAHYKTIADGIKAELFAAANPDPDAADVEARIDLAPGVGPAIRLQWKTRTGLDTKRIQAERPDIYADYGKVSGAWELRELKS